MRDGLKVVVFEQTAEVLEQRLGFRVAQYGLRQAFMRIPGHPLLAGINADNLHDWRGEATILPPRLKYKIGNRYAPSVLWCGIEQTRVWRCGNYGDVASVLIEKPTRGDFLPIVDGGFSLQYSPLVEYRQGKGMVLFCQLDVTGRSEADPAAERLAANIVRYVSAWKPGPARKALYAGEAAGKEHLTAAGANPGAYDGGKLTPDQVLVVGPGGGRRLAVSADAIGQWLKSGGRLVAVGLGQDEANALLPFKVTMQPAEHIAAYFDPPTADSPLAGVGPADVHNRDPRKVPLVVADAAGENGEAGANAAGADAPAAGGATIGGNGVTIGGTSATVLGDGVLAATSKPSVVFWQLAPWRFDYSRQYNIKRTYRRVSFTLTRLLANAGVGLSTPLLERFAKPVSDAGTDKRYLDGLYLDQPEENDDPYRFFGW